LLGYPDHGEERTASRHRDEDDPDESGLTYDTQIETVSNNH